MRAEYSDEQQAMIVDMDEFELKEAIEETLKTWNVTLTPNWKLRITLPILKANVIALEHPEVEKSQTRIVID